jgi:hypothetical protein
VTIKGSNAIIDGNGLEIHPSAEATISGVLIQRAGAVAIANRGRLHLTSVTISDTQGGGITNLGFLSINSSTIRNSGSGITHGLGGELNINNSMIENNASTGIIASSGTATINNTTIRNNKIGIQPSGLMTVTNSLIHGNSNGGIDAAGGSDARKLTLVNSTISGNGGSGLNRGGLFTLGLDVQLINVTITSNTGFHTGGILVANGVDVTVRNTLSAGNTATQPTNGVLFHDCALANPSLPGAALISEGHNLIGVSAGCTISGDTTGNILDVDAKLDSLKDNGGPTKTHTLLAGSPAIVKGNPAGCTNAQNQILTTDQRSLERPVDGDGDGLAECDIGAFEFGATQSGVGTSAPTQSATLVKADQPLRLTLRWDHPLNWRALDDIDLIMREGEHVAFRVRFHESKQFSSTLALLDEFGNQVGFGVPGEELVLENDVAAFNLLQSSQTSGGPSAPDVTVTFVVSFKQAAAGRQFSIDAAATDDDGAVAVDANVGRISVGPFKLHLPLVTH